MSIDFVLDVRRDLAAAFRWTARFNISLAINEDGSRFLMNPNQMHFSRITASSLIELDANDPNTMQRADAPDPTAWGLHGSIHRACPHARCVMHAHPIFSTVLATLKNPELPPIDQNTAMFYQRYVVDNDFGGLAFSDEGERCAKLLSDPSKFAMIMGNHGMLVVGQTVAQTFNRLYYFERAAETYIRALQTGLPLNVLSHDIAERTAAALENYPGYDDKFLAELRAILDAEGDNYAQ